MTDAQRLDELRRLSEAATPGEWKWGGGKALWVHDGETDTYTDITEPLRVPNAEFITALVNAFRAGDLVSSDSVRGQADALQAATDARDRAISAYEAKVQDFAAETLRGARMVRQCREVLDRIKRGKPPRSERQIALHEGITMIAEEMLRLYQLPVAALGVPTEPAPKGTSGTVRCNWPGCGAPAHLVDGLDATKDGDPYLCLNGHEFSVPSVAALGVGVPAETPKVEYRSDPHIVVNPEGDKRELDRARRTIDAANAARDAAAGGVAAEPAPKIRECICDGAAYFSDRANAARRPFLVDAGCAVHGTPLLPVPENQTEQR